ncbi:phosphonopyruvate decarboxylase [Campylobacter insulaenigrae]|uniref:Phosphonopyruvate decarboxylase n=1 Tax=Campylobacter insulaenigrae TaxID=260714 RepID=A0ABY3G6J6_9BACT|nr:phosphonopyruvate decarboxylase [Campylobacter insulaenigrae]MCR6572172.1 phosphonopyruvate decarboxylase [Campylobacter insulaenigrae]MCR6580951.1 phosphonopyruvate decarboxylase [Campylobacter insulaenigrae]TWO26033.1 phosphonopyruvate decarboxylase [Campylobacter insulaenigrae]
MLDIDIFFKELDKIGCELFSGVPCSYLSSMINYTINNNKFLMSNNEGDAVAIATGVSLSYMEKDVKKFGVVLMQNSGLSNALSPLTSLNFTFKIPILGFVSLRGERDEYGNNTDEPQHELLGEITDKLLKLCQIEYDILSSDTDIALEQIQKAFVALQQRKTFFFIVKNNTFSKHGLKKQSFNNLNREFEIYCEKDYLTPVMSRYQVLSILNDFNNSDCLLLATTGKTGRELYKIHDHDNYLYMVGSMGCVSSLGLGLSLNTCKKVISIDGDSALLMRLGVLSTNSYYSKLANKGNFCHILLDNESHDSTGGQLNLSPYIDFVSIVKACFYEKIFAVNTVDGFKKALDFFVNQEKCGSVFIYVKILKGSVDDLPRPKITPKEVAKRIAQFLK